MTPIISTSQLTKRYILPNGPLALRGVDLEVHSGEIFSLLGPNGAGKSTLIAILCGLFPPTSGEVRVAGYDVVGAGRLAVKRLIGVVPEEIALYPSLTGVQNLEFFGELHHLDKKLLRKKIQEALEITGLTGRANDRVAQYSNGMKRRLNIAVAMLHDPMIYFLDEPTLGLDPQNRRRILNLVTLLRQEAGKTIIYTTHNMEEAAEISDRVAIMHQGQIIKVGTPENLIQQLELSETLELQVTRFPADDQEGVLPPPGLGAVPGIKQALWDGDRLVLSLEPGEQHPSSHLLPVILKQLDKAGWVVISISTQRPTLETVFFRLTGQPLKIKGVDEEGG